MSACRSCGAPIRWERTVAGKAIPLDPQPTEKGNVAIIDGKAHVLGKRPAPGAEVYMPHHATCPNWGRNG